MGQNPTLYVTKIVSNETGREIDPDDILTSIPASTKTVTTVNVATYDIEDTDDILHVTYTSTAAVTSLTLQTSLLSSGKEITIKDTGFNAATNSITVDTEGDETIDGGATAIINDDGDAINIYSDGINWFIY